MKKPAPLAPDQSKTRLALPERYAPVRRDPRPSIESLKLKVLNLAEHHMDVAVQVLKRWLGQAK